MEVANLIEKPLSYLGKAEKAPQGLEESKKEEYMKYRPADFDHWETEEAYNPANHLQDWKWLEIVSVDFWMGNPAWQTR